MRYHSVEITEIHSDTFLAKILWKQLNSWFQGIFFVWERISCLSTLWYRILERGTVLDLAQCGNFRNWPLLRFCMKSNSVVHWKSQKWPFLLSQTLRILILVILCNFQYWLLQKSKFFTLRLCNICCIC